MVLDAIVADGSLKSLVAPLARGLMAHRVQGRWSNTQENAFAVAALARYLAVAEAVAPDLTVRSWTDRRVATEHAFRGRSDERREFSIPADSLGRPGMNTEVIVAREGKGRVYYRVGLSYAVAEPTPALSRGFEVMRTYEAVDDSADVRLDSSGTWHIRAGARVRVRVSLAAAGPRYHVALIDHLPAGLEAVNPALAGVAGWNGPMAAEARGFPAPSPRTAGPLPFPIEHVNVRADRYEVFTSLLQPGRREITYLALATTPGEFIAPAPRAEELYSPETFGRGPAARVVIGDRSASTAW